MSQPPVAGRSVEGREALQEILRLYDFSDPEVGKQTALVTQQLIDGIVAVEQPPGGRPDRDADWRRASAAASRSRSSSTSRSTSAPASSCSPACWSASWGCMRRSTRSASWSPGPSRAKSRSRSGRRGPGNNLDLMEGEAVILTSGDPGAVAAIDGPSPDTVALPRDRESVPVPRAWSEALHQATTSISFRRSASCSGSIRPGRSRTGRPAPVRGRPVPGSDLPELSAQLDLRAGTAHLGAASPDHDPGIHGPDRAQRRPAPALHRAALPAGADAKGPERNALRDWLDLFNHRIVSLFYRAWEKYRFYLPYERGI